MRPARLVAALLLAGGAVLGTAPAASAASPSGAWTSPAPAGAVDDIPVAYLQAPGRLGGWAEFDQGITGVAFTLVKDAGDPSDPCSAATGVKPQSTPGGTNRVEFAFDASFPCNRRYQVRATVAPAQKPLRRDTPLVLNLWVAVAIPPAPVSGLAVDVGAARDVGLRWDAGTHEPDFQGYEIRRAMGGTDFERIGEVGPSVTTFGDRDVPARGGTVRYQVVGMRPGPDAGTTVFGDPGSTAEIDVPAASGAAATEEGSGGGAGREPTVAGGGAVTPTGSGQQFAHRVFQPPTATRRSTTPTTADTGYQETLPFQQPADGGDAAVVARLDDDDDGGQRQTLLLIAGASTAFSWAMALRFLTRRATLGF